LLSYALLRGRCRHCHTRISPLYPAVELAGAALIVACFALFGVTARAALASGFCALLVTLSAIAARERGAVSRASH
jgi:leader peptidase (prepilin peptidase)/N-methyltransferase